MPGAHRRILSCLLLLLTARPIAVGAAPLEPAASLSPPDGVLLDGLSKLHQGRFSRGMLEFRTFLQANPTDPRGHLFLAFGDWWRRLQMGADPQDSSMEYHLQEAIRLGQEGLSRDPGNSALLTTLGTAYIFLAQYRAAERKGLRAAMAAKKGKSLLEQAMSAHPDDSDPRFGLGAYNYYADKVNLLVKGLRTMLFLPGGDSVKGLAQLQEASERSHYFRTESHLLLAIIYQGRHERRYLAALDHLQAALELNPNSPIILGTVGELQIRLGRYAEARETLQRGLEICLQSGDREVAELGRMTRILLADSLELSFRSDDALREIESAMPGGDLSSDWKRRALSVATRAASRLGDRDRLEAIYRAARLSPEEVAALRTRYAPPSRRQEALARQLEPIRAKIMKGAPEAAVPLLEEVLNRNPDSPEVLIHLAWARFAQERWTDAAAILRRIPVDAASGTPGWIVGWRDLLLGRCLVEMGQPSEGKDCYRRAEELEGFRARDLARALLGPEGNDPRVWPSRVFASGIEKG